MSEVVKRGWGVSLLVAGASAAACSAASVHPSVEQATTEPRLEGVYMPTGAGSAVFEFIRFSGDAYEAKLSRCSGTSCTRAGKFRVSPGEDRLVLEDDLTGARTTLALSEAANGRGPSDATVEARSLSPRDAILDEATTPLLVSSFTMTCLEGCDGASGPVKMQTAAAESVCDLCRVILVCAPVWCTINHCCG